MAKRKALVVGINYAGSDAELHGAVNDALRWEKALESFGVHDTWVMVDEFPLCVLLNSGCSAVRCRYPSGEVVGAEDDGSYSVPTKENILQGLDWLSAGASKGDCLTLIYCGRAAQVQGFAGAYPVEEALCPLDWEGSMTYYVITDQDLHRCFASLPATSIAIADARTDVNALPRHVSRVVRRSFWTLLGRLLPDERKPLDEGLAVFCITACGPGQSAIEAYLNDSQQGVLTFCLLQALQNLRESTFLEWLTAADKEASKLRSKVMPAMDQFFEIAYGRHVGLESRLFDPACALLAKERAKRRRGESWQ